MRNRRNFGKCTVALTLAIGMLLSCFCPPKFLVAVLCIWVIILALAKNRCQEDFYEGCNCKKSKIFWRSFKNDFWN